MTEERKTNTPETEEVAESKNFILNFIDEDIAEGGQFQGMTVHTRFPPEPNGYLHIGHCKALCIDFGTAEKYNGLCNLRMDDTNPAKEDTEYVDAIQQDIHWLGFDWGDRFFYGSDYFEKDYEYAVELIKKGLAYVCELTPEEFSKYRGDTQHMAEAEEWINFIASTSSNLANMDYIWYASPNREALEQYPAYYQEVNEEELDPEIFQIMAPPAETLERCEIYENLPKETLKLYDRLWTRLGV